MKSTMLSRVSGRVGQNMAEGPFPIVSAGSMLSNNLLHQFLLSRQVPFSVIIKQMNLNLRFFSSYNLNIFSCYLWNQQTNSLHQCIQANHIATYCWTQVFHQTRISAFFKFYMPVLLFYVLLQGDLNLFKSTTAKIYKQWRSEHGTIPSLLICQILSWLPHPLQELWRKRHLCKTLRHMQWNSRFKQKVQTKVRGLKEEWKGRDFKRSKLGKDLISRSQESLSTPIHKCITCVWTVEYSQMAKREHEAGTC